jgi:hypothetical protein
MRDTDSDPATSTAVGEQAESTSTIAAKSDSKCNVVINKETFDSWGDALRGARKVVNKNKDDIATLWYRTTIIHEGDGSFSLRCATCHKAFSMKNPANFWQSHKKTCPVAERGSEITREQVNSSLTISAVRRLKESSQRGVETFTLSRSQIDKFSSGIVKAIVTGNIAFTFVENPHLMEAMSAIGVPTISRKQLTNRWIPKLAEEASLATEATLEKALLVDASSDGWRKKYCEQGASLNNIVALLPERAYFHDAINCSSMRKDAESIAQLLTTAAKSMVGHTDEDLERLVGWVLDNTKANWRAMLKLEEEHPKWIMRGCFAHSIALLMKDFCKFKTATGRGAATRSFGMKWAEECVEDGNKIANFLQDSGVARQVVAEKQKEVMDGRRPTINVNVPTRWATNYLVLSSILHSRTALMLAAASEAWGQLSSGSQTQKVQGLLLDGEFWRDVTNLVELLHPFSDAIHQLEGDKPHLAECHLALVVLRKHVEDWAKKHRTEGLAEDELCPVTGRALATMDRRLDASPGGSVAPVYSAAYSAAFSVDPFYADVEEMSYYTDINLLYFLLTL